MLITTFHKQSRHFWKILFLMVLPPVIIFLTQCTGSKPQKIVPTESSVTKHLPQMMTSPTPYPIDNPPEPPQVTPPITPIDTIQPTKIQIDISKQVLEVYAGEQLVKSYPISTSKYGIGNLAGSNKTPLGLHIIENKIGADAPAGTIFKSRRNTGKLAKINQETEDLVTSRILWLKGIEKGKNVGPGIDSYQRCIYIHGTAAEKDIGKPASHGCVRMLNQDVIELFEWVKVALPVSIICSQQHPETQECQYDLPISQTDPQVNTKEK